MSYIATVDANANQEWKDEVDAVIDTLASNYPTFTSDDIWALVDSTTHDNRAMGPRVTAAVKAGLIQIATCDHCHTTKVMAQSKREEAHGMDIAVYRSRRFRTTT